jgi:hypothetical protein
MRDDPAKRVRWAVKSQRHAPLEVNPWTHSRPGRFPSRTSCASRSGRSARRKWFQDWFDLWRDLHCRTNGYATDYETGLVRLFRRKPAFQPTSGLIGPMTEERAASLVAEVNETGVSVVKQHCPWWRKNSSVPFKAICRALRTSYAP